MLTQVYLGKGEEAIEVKVRRSSKAKYTRIKFTSSGEVELVISKREAIKNAVSFLKSKEDLIRARLKDYEPKSLNIIKEIPILGNNYAVVFEDASIGSIRLQDDSLIFPSVHKKHFDKMVLSFLKAIIYQEILKNAEVMSKELGVSFKKIVIKDTTSIWGSCSKVGNLSFCWRLIFAPKFIVHYVVAHELCHLIEMNHSDRFWKLVENIYPEYRAARIWLRQNGNKLHQFCIDNLV